MAGNWTETEYSHAVIANLWWAKHVPRPQFEMFHVLWLYWGFYVLSKVNLLISPAIGGTYLRECIVSLEVLNGTAM